MAVYMDHNATTPLAPSVVKKVSESLISEWGNPSSTHEPGLIAKRAIDEARGYVAEMIGASSSDIIFTSGGTEANNMVILGVPEYFNSRKKLSNDFISCKPHVITTVVEHDATLMPLKYLEQRGDISVSLVSMDANGCVNVDELISYVRPTTCLITVMLANNETGVVMPVQEISRRTRELNANRPIRILLHSDAAQGVGKVAVDVDDLGVDYLTVVGHKYYGPRIGCLYVRGRLGGAGKATPVYPLLYGGGQEDGHRPGTLNTPMIVGLGEASRLVSLHLKRDQENMRLQRDYLEESLKRTFGDKVVFNCSVNFRLPNTSSACFPGDDAGHAILSKCPRVLASVGAACHDQSAPSAILLHSGVSNRNARNTIRFSVGRDTTAKDIDMVVEDLRKALGRLDIKESSGPSLTTLPS